MARPARDDLRRTIRNGLHGTSMPAFHSLLTDVEIEQVIDYVIFLSMRGETELALIEIAALADEKDPDSFSDEIVKEAADAVFKKWKPGQAQVVNPPVPRTPSNRESILRGRELFLKTDCKDCHGTLARGDGGSFVPQDVFNFVLFGGNPSERQARLDTYDAKIKEMWKQKPDEWGNPLRPANLNRPVYKGGRRPIDLYWRIAKGINGSQMPGHYPSINEQQIWDLVNFLLVLPYEPELLADAPPPAPSGGALAGR
jgi:mono/diheme cytochrome c family protein